MNLLSLLLKASLPLHTVTIAPQGNACRVLSALRVKKVTINRAHYSRFNINMSKNIQMLDNSKKRKQILVELKH